MYLSSGQLEAEVWPGIGFRAVQGLKSLSVWWKTEGEFRLLQNNLTYLVIRGKQIKANMKYYFTPNDWEK